MKRRNIVLALLLVIGLMAFPQMGAAAGMVPLSEAQLSDVIGQSGVSIKIDNLNFDETIETLAYGDTDGLGPGTNTTAGWISLCGVVLKGSANFPSPLTVDVVTTRNSNGSVGLTSLNMTMTAMNLKVDQFSIDAIRLGSQPGIGGSLGSLYMSNMVANITGNIKISAF
jgi:hypothetical protein